MNLRIRTLEIENVYRVSIELYKHEQEMLWEHEPQASVSIF